VEKAASKKHVIIGTAGHVDHGKTELVRALTGRETDRLEEEKRRGISIVLGFAPIDLGRGIEAGVVDVPGHERFVKNMVSGAVGVDVALMAVAADEGVMPQTEEHFEVLRLLGVRSGVVAVTKVDLAGGEMAEVVESEIADLLAGTPLEGCPMIRTSIMTGEGISELRDALARTAAEVASRGGGGFFRMPVDRVFTRSGIGTIVTGTAWNGRVSTGDELTLEPSGRRVRVREVQSFEHDVDESVSGMRTALALHGVKAGEVSAGEQLVTPGSLPVTSIIDVRLEMSRLQGSKLKNRQRVRLHHAAAEILARAVLLDAELLGSGGNGMVQLRLERPTAAMRGDGFVLRTYSPMRILAGGRILDPAAPKAKRFSQGRLSLLAALDRGDAAGIIGALSSSAGIEGLEPGVLSGYGIGPIEAAEAQEALASEGVLVEGGGRFFHAEAARLGERRVLGELEKFASENELAWGIDREELRTRAGLSGSPLFDLILEAGGKEGSLFFRGGKVRAGSAELELSVEMKGLIERLGERISEAGWAFPSGADLVPLAEGDGGRMLSCLRILQEEGRILRIGGDGWISARAIEEVKNRAGRIIADKGSMSVGDFKGELGISRKYAVPLLEYLDSEGYTRRAGDSRIAGPSLQGRG
jgi:selenocysteine-specific elongation factor